MIRRPHGPLELGIGADAYVLALVFKRINIGQSVECHRIAEADAGCAIAIDFVSRDFAVLGGADLHLAVGRGPAAASSDLAGAIEHELDWRIGLPRQFGGHDALNIGTEFAAETTAHVVRDALDLIGRYAEVSRKDGSGSSDCLRRSPYGQLAVRIPFGNQAVRFQALMTNGWHAVAALDRHGCIGHTFLETLRRRLLGRQHIVALAADRRDRLRIVFQRILFLNQVRQYFVLDLDSANRVESMFLRISGEAKNLFAGPKQFLTDFFDRMNRFYTRHLFGRGGIETLDLGMGVRAAQQHGVQHALAIDVVAVFGLAGRLGGTVEALHFGADQSAFFWPGRCHDLALLLSRSQARLVLAQCYDGVAHLLISAETADIAGQRFLNLGGRGVGVLVEGGTHGHDKAGRAEAALLGVVLDERRRHRIEFAAVDEALGGLDLLALGLQRQQGAGVDRFAVYHHCASTACTAITDALTAGDIEVIAQGVEQRDAWLNIGSHGRAIDIECELDRLRPDGLGRALGRRLFGKRRRH